MRRLKLLGLTVLALFAFAAALATSASAALPANLPELAGARAFTGEAVGTSTFETLAKLKIECKKATAEGSEESKKPLGSLHIHFLECEGTINKVKSKCNSLADAAGIILILIGWHLVFDTLGAGEALKTALLYLLTTPIHIECALGAALILITGQVLCLHLNPTVSSKTHETHCVQTAGMPEHTLYFNAAGEMVNITNLESSLNGSISEIGAELALSKQITTEEIAADQ